MSSNIYVKHFANTLKLVRQHLGHTKIPHKFKIPKTSEFPIELHDKNFGKSVLYMRHKYKKNQLSKVQIDLLEKENMIWNVPEHKFQYNLKGFQLYKKIHGNMLVPTDFIVPSTKDWPEEYWGCKLGNLVFHLRSSKKELKKQHIEQLNGIGFIWNTLEGRMNNIYIPALQWYKQKFNHLKVPNSYRIPVDDGAIPKAIQGLQLGSFLRRMAKTKGRLMTDTQKKQAHDIGYSFTPNLKSQYNHLVLQLQDYYKQHGSLAIPQNYRMDEYRLGNSFRVLVSKKSYERFYDAKVMQAMGLYRDITDAMFDQIVAPELDQHRQQNPNQKIYSNTAGPNGMVHLGYLKHHCKHPKLVAYLAKYNL